MDDNFIIEVKNLTKKFGSFTAVNSVSFNVKKGEIFGFLGANGAGKTTALRMLCGLLKPTSGNATVAGYNVYKHQEDIKKNIGYMSQRFSLYEDLTVRENIRFYGGIYGLTDEEIRERTNALLDKMNIQNLKDKLIKSLPLGWKQKLAFLIAINHNPSVVFLDEPTQGVDPLARRQFWNMIYETSIKGITVMITTHYLEEAEYCKRISIMVQGKIAVIGSPSELKHNFNSESIHDVFIKVSKNNISKTDETV